MKFFRAVTRYLNELPALQYCLVFAMAFALFAFFQANRLILDPDTFYHLKIVQMMTETHQPVTSFPWLTATALSRIYVDHHLIYHALLVPFVVLFSPFIGGKIFTALIAATLLTFMFFFFRQEKIELAWYFTFLAASSFNFIFRLNLIKASGIAILVLLFGIWALFNKRFWLAAAIAAIYVSVHGGFILYLVAATIMVAANSFEITANSIIPAVLRSRFGLFKDFIRNCFAPLNLKTFFSVLGGTALGVAISPYHLKLLPFLQEQLIQVGIFTKLTTVRMGNEWYPFPFDQFFLYNAVILITFSLSLVICLMDRNRRNAKTIFFLLFSSFFLILTMRSRRFIEYFVPTAIIFSALVMPDILTWGRGVTEAMKSRGKLQFVAIAMMAIIAIGPVVVGGSMIWEMAQSLSFGRDISYMEGVAGWLKANTQPEEIIFHTDWSDFPSLFYWDSDNYYLVGLDPTFMYIVSPSLYTMYEDIVRGKTTQNLKTTIMELFHSTVIVVKPDATVFAENMEKSGDFIKVYKDSDATIYKAK